MIYLMLYLALGLVYAITGMVVWRETPFLRRLLCVVALWIFWPLMVAAIIHEKWVLRKLVGKCAWCGELVEDSYPVGNESWRKHALECKQHPLRAELTKTEHRAIAAENELDYLRWLLEKTGHTPMVDYDGRPYLKSRDCEYFPTREAWEKKKGGEG